MSVAFGNQLADARLRRCSIARCARRPWPAWWWAALSILTAVFLVSGAWCRWRALGWAGGPCGRFARRPTNGPACELARLGIGLSVGLWVVGYGWLIFARVREIPYGYQLVSYETLQPDPSVPAEADPPVGPRLAGQAGLHQGLHAAAPAADGHQGVRPLSRSTASARSAPPIPSGRK